MDRDQGRAHEALAPTPPKRSRKDSPERVSHNTAGNGDSQQSGYGPQQQEQEQPQSPEHHPQPQQPPEHSVHQEQQQTEALVHRQDNQKERDDTAGPGITNLAPMTLLEVFSWLPWEEVYGHVSRVCRDWRDLLRGRCPCASLTFSGDDALQRAVSGERARAILRSARNLKNLEICKREDAFELLGEVPRHNTELRRLKLCECLGHRNRANLSRSLAALFDACLGISELFLQEIQCQSSEHLTNLGGRLPELKMIRLDNIRWEGPAVLGDVLSSCARLEDLRVYCIEGAALFDQDVARLSATLRGTLTVLKIDRYGLTNEGFSALATLPHLRELSVYFAPGLTDAGMPRLAPLRRRLEVLRLTGPSGVTAGGWRQLFRQGVPWPALRKLSLEGCVLVDDSVVGAVAGVCPALERVNLVDCGQVTAVGAARLQQACQLLRPEHLVLQLPGDVNMDCHVM